MDRHDRQRMLGAMNAFDRAKAKYENKAQGQKTVVVDDIHPKPVVEVPKEKPERKRTEAVFDVRVYLPDGEIVFALTKQDIYSNVPKAKVTQMELKKAVAKGLEGLLGAVK